MVTHLIDDQHLWSEIDSHAPIEAAFAIRAAEIGDQIVRRHEVRAEADWIAASANATHRCVLIFFYDPTNQKPFTSLETRLELRQAWFGSRFTSHLCYSQGFFRLSSMLTRNRRPRLVISSFIIMSLPWPKLAGQNNDASSRTFGVASLSGSMSPSARLEDDRGAIEGTRTLSHMTLTFKRTPEQRAALNRLLEELQNPLSPNYHKWLTPEEFGARFGPSVGSLNHVADWLQSEGFTVASIARGRGWIEFSGTVAQVQNTFHTEIHHYQVGGQAHFAAATPPSVPMEFGPLIGGLRGLDDFYLEPPSRHLEPFFTASDGSHALAPGDLAIIYDYYGTSLTGYGLTVAVAGQSAVNLADIRQFRSTFQLPANDPQILLVGDDPGTVASAMIEADSDLEWVGAVAKDATIVYAYATDALVAAQKVIDQNLAPILTFSFGICEANRSPSDATFFQGIAQLFKESRNKVAHRGSHGSRLRETPGPLPAIRGPTLPPTG